MQKKDAVDYDKIIVATTMLLEAIGEDPKRPGLIDTPIRVAKAWRDFMGYRDPNTETVFENVVTDQLVIVRGIEVWSMCEHHLMPFRALVSIGYLTVQGEHRQPVVLGLSKFARIAKLAAHRLQLQERLAADISGEIRRVLQHDNVGVHVRGEHTCITARGIEAHGSDMVNLELHGAFRESLGLRSEFLSMIGVKP